MGWNIQCTDPDCEQGSWANNIVDLIASHRDTEGWFLCPCGKQGYIEKRFQLQEPGEVWEPYLRGVIPLGDPDDSYQPFVFLVSYQPNGEVTDVWFSYYKDLRDTGGRLKLGYGPGGPPVLHRDTVLQLLSHLVRTRCLSRDDIYNAIE